MLGLQTILLACLAAGAMFAYVRFRSPQRDGAAEREALGRVMAALPEQLELARRARLTAAEAAAVSAGSSGHGESSVERAGPTGMELDLRLAEILTLSIRADRIANKYRLPGGNEACAESTDARTTGEHETLRAAPPPRALQSSLSSIAPS